MSRGPGRRQRALLEAVNEHGAVGVTHPDDTASEQVAYRRAAYILEAAGKIELRSAKVEGIPRLVAYPAGTAVSTARYIRGNDGKRYRSDTGGAPVRAGELEQVQLSADEARGLTDRIRGACQLSVGAEDVRTARLD